MDLDKRRESLLTALREGGYQFGKTNLKFGKNDSIQGCEFCLFGVACDVYRLQHQESSRWERDRWTNHHRFICHSEKHGYERSYLTPPFAVLDYFGIAHNNRDALIGANDRCDKDDDAPKSLSDCAELLDSMWEADKEGLFWIGA